MFFLNIKFIILIYRALGVDYMYMIMNNLGIYIHVYTCVHVCITFLIPLYIDIRMALLNILARQIALVRRNLEFDARTRVMR